MSGGWNTIESDAGVFTYLVENLGVEHVQFEELVALDAEILRQASPVYGVVFLFKYPTGETRDTIPHDGTFDHAAAENLFFAAQTIQNACGTQALLSVLLNQDERVEVGPQLRDFKEFTGAFPSDLRGEALSNSELIRDVHNSFAKASPFVDETQRTATDDDDVYHFIAYTSIHNTLYELDGLQPAPISHGDCTFEEFPDKVIPVLQRRIERYPSHEIRFNLLAMVRDLRIKAIEIRDEEGVRREEAKRVGWRWENALRRHNFVGFTGEVLRAVVREKVSSREYEAWVEESVGRTKKRIEEKTKKGSNMEIEEVDMREHVSTEILRVVESLHVRIMPSIVRRLSVIAAADGLVLQPIAQRNQRPVPSLKITYGTHELAAVGPSEESLSSAFASFEAHGIVGLLSVASTSYLISISRRAQVAQIRGKPIYVITGIALIPLSSHSDARFVVEQTRESLKKQAKNGVEEDSETSEDDQDGPPQGQDDDHITAPASPADGGDDEPGPSKSDSTVAQDVISRRGQYGRFAERWFSRKGWSVEGRRLQGMSTDQTGKPQPKDEKNVNVQEKGLMTGNVDGSAESVESKNAPQSMKQQHSKASEGESATRTLLPKLLYTTRMMLSSRSFFFSYDYDLTWRLGSQDFRNAELPLHKLVNSLYFWNRHLTSPFVHAGQHAFVLPVMQGFVGQRAFTVNVESDDPSKSIAAAQENVGEIIELQNNARAAQPSDKTRDYLITLISRRSVKRPGLRYLRRGVDDKGHTANSVETEQILSTPSWAESNKVYSFSQFRGSIPLYFSQSPYSFKPVPELQHSYERNHAAFRRHFTNLTGRYGGVQIALLVEKHGVEAKIGEEYEKHMEQLNKENGINGTELGFKWFDFHAMCRGMKFENVSILMDSLNSKLDSFSETIEVNGKIQQKQSGILRTNCMDCLDRTNVVQSACGQRALEQQLAAEGIALDFQTDVSTQWFNTLWADNGDAISKQYSSTAALKGDYTRTRKRDYRGALNDFGLTLSRFFNNIVNDFFSQAAIDYLLGNVTAQIFEDFEANMMSADPAMSMAKVRQHAIDTSAKIVIENQNEDLLHGWTLLCPHEQNTLRTLPFEEAVLLLTDVALYAVRFDWNMEKVSSFERVDLRSIISVVRGTYITSALAPTQTDETRNVGFVVRYVRGEENVAKRNTRSMSTAVPDPPDKIERPEEAEQESILKSASSATLETSDASVSVKKTGQDSISILAFKALPSRSSTSDSSSVRSQRSLDSPPLLALGETETIRSITEEIERAVRKIENHSEKEDGPMMIEDRDIISVAEAKKSTGLLEQWSYSLKKLVWA